MGANKSRITDTSIDIKQNIYIFQNKRSIENIKSKYILKLIFDYLNKRRVLELINYNKNIQKKLDIGINDYYNEYINPIIIEIIPEKRRGIFINYIGDENNYHIFFNDEINERKKNYISKRDNVKKIKIILDYEVKSFKELFRDCITIEKINFIKFRRKDIIDMSSMFDGCLSLIEVNLSNFETENVKDMSFMFHQCKSLTELNLSKFNTKEVTNMSSIFSKCSSLEKIDLSTFDTQNVEDMSYMFYRCESLTELNISNFEFKEKVIRTYMFSECYSLIILNIKNFDEKDINNIFYGFSDKIIQYLKKQKKNNNL